MTGSLVLALAIAAASVGALHSLAPDHWVPIAAVSRARGWSLARTRRVALLCGFGHVTVSALLGVIAVVSGTAVVETFGARTATVAAAAMIGFGIAYALWGARRIHGHDHGHDHGHPHRHPHGDRDPSATSTWTLFAIYCADPCIAVVPIIFAAAPLSVLGTIGIVAVYEVATIATMVTLAVVARAGATAIRGRWVERYGDSAAGGLIAVTGVAVALLGW